jgi:hypothetical protein
VFPPGARKASKRIPRREPSFGASLPLPPSRSTTWQGCKQAMLFAPQHQKEGKWGMKTEILLWGRHPNYAKGLWFKLARNYDFAEYTYREQLGFELAYLSIDANPNNITYNPSHPWYYRQGGQIQTPREIMEEVRESGYKGYNYDAIERTDRMEEPRRSETLRALRQKYRSCYKRDVARYRKYAFQLKMARKNGTPLDVNSINNDVCLNLGLKASHLTNDFAHLIKIEERLSRQGDLFDF